MPLDHIDDEAQAQTEEPSVAEELPRASNPWLAVIRVAIVVILVGVTVLLLINRDKLVELQHYGYPGLFLFSIISNATIIIPLPGVALTSVMGAVFHPFWVAIVAGAGAGIGELSGYLAGFSGRGVAQKSKRYDKVVGWMRKYGEWAVLALAFIPNPLFDLAGMIAGMLKMPVWKFLLFCIVGKILKMLAFAYLGASLGNLFL